MQSATMTPLSEYLSTSYRPDCDYLDGVVLERNVGERDHSRTQTLLAGYFLSREERWGVRVFTEQRIQVRPTRFRVPDICVVLGETPGEQTFTSPPLLCIEILSPSDRLGEMQDRVGDYLAFGVKHVWLVNPQTRKAFVCDRDGLHEVKDGVLRASSEIVLPLSEIPL